MVTLAAVEMRILRMVRREGRPTRGSATHAETTLERRDPRRRAILRLLVSGEIERVGEGDWRLTEKGEARLAAHEDQERDADPRAA